MDGILSDIKAIDGAFVSDWGRSAHHLFEKELRERGEVNEEGASAK